MTLTQPGGSFVSFEAGQRFVRLAGNEHFERQLREGAGGYDQQRFASSELFDTAEQVAVERVGHPCVKKRLFVFGSLRVQQPFAGVATLLSLPPIRVVKAATQCGQGNRVKKRVT